jgi:hypothetical protein
MPREGLSMLRCVLLAVAITVSPALAYAGPKEDSQAVFDRFQTAFTAADVDAVVVVLAGRTLLGHNHAQSRNNAGALSKPRLWWCLIPLS